MSREDFHEYADALFDQLEKDARTALRAGHDFEEIVLVCSAHIFEDAKQTAWELIDDLVELVDDLVDTEIN